MFKIDNTNINLSEIYENKDNWSDNSFWYVKIYEDEYTNRNIARIHYFKYVIIDYDFKTDKASTDCEIINTVINFIFSKFYKSSLEKDGDNYFIIQNWSEPNYTIFNIRVFKLNLSEETLNKIKLLISI